MWAGLGQLLITLFVGLATFLAQWLSKKLALGLAAVATFGIITTALFVLLRSTLSTLSSSSSIGGVAAHFFGAAIPPVAPMCISAYTTVWVGCTLYRWQVKALDVFLKV